MSSFVDHVFLTRFNLPAHGVESLFRQQPGWLEDRVQLFERHCLPSVTSQTDTDFRWIVYLDPDSPAWLRERVEGYENTGVLTAHYANPASPKAIEQDLRALIDKPRSHLLTTNLDNDDALAVDFVRRLRQAVPGGPEPRAIFFVNGLILGGSGLFRRRDRHNAFCSVFESWDAPQTCWSDWHNLLSRRMPVIELKGPPAWLQVVHGGNVSNRVRGRIADVDRYEHLFPRQFDSAVRPRARQVILDRAVLGPGRSVRELCRATAKWFVMRIIGKSGLDHAKLFLARRKKKRSAGSPPSIPKGPVER